MEESTPTEVCAALSYGKVLKRLRTERGMTLKEVSEQTGVPIISLARIEQEITHRPSLATLTKLSKLFGVPPGYILSLAEDERQPIFLKPLLEDSAREIFWDPNCPTPMTGGERAALIRLYEAAVAAAYTPELPPDLEAIIARYDQPNRELAYNLVPPIISALWTLLLDRRSGSPRPEHRSPPTPGS